MCALELAGPVLFLSTLSLRRATPRGGYCYLDNIISIHALLAESDAGLIFFLCAVLLFLSTLSLRRATSTHQKNPSKLAFLSTLSLRRATTWTRGSRATYVISIHALLAESDVPQYQILDEISISIHALLAESDRFQAADISARRISIHALLAESDASHFMPNNGTLHFYPRSPCGERRALR